MYRILVVLSIKDFEAFEKFEAEAAKIMSAYQGKIVSAFETMRNNNGTGEEVHLLEFENERGFTDYRNDNRLEKLSDLREQAISATQIKICQREKSYS